nr:glycosyltransferase family 2 protein [Paenibacillus lutrae]
MIRSKLVSIIIPTYNRENLLHRPIESVLNQTYSNWELLIVDDGSQDNTRQLIESYSQKDSRIKYIANDRSKGPSGARNSGIIQSEGEYIAFLDSDDEWLEHHLLDSIEILEKKNVEVCFSLWIEKHAEKEIRVFDPLHTQNNLKQKASLFETYKNAIIFDDRFFEHYATDDGWFYHINTMVIQRQVLNRVGLLNEKYFTGEDTEFFIRFFAESKIALINNYHFLYHQTPDSLYNFFDRSQVDIESLCKDKALCDKITNSGINSNEIRLMIRKRVQQSKRIKDKKKCFRTIDGAIARKYLTLSYINRDDFRKSVYFCLLSLRYRFNKNKILYLFNLLPFRKTRAINQMELDFY